MKKTVLLIICAISLGFIPSLHAQEIRIQNGRKVRGSGSEATQTYDVGKFTGVKSSSGVRVEIVKGDGEVSVRTDSKALDYIRVTVNNGVLSVGYDNNVNVRNITTTFFVSAPDLDRLTASSGSTIIVTGKMNGSRLAADSSSAGVISLPEAEYGEVKVSVSSGGSVIITGKAETVNISAGSGGSAVLSGLKAHDVKVTASSGGAIKAYASESATGSASSGGSIRISGDPRNIDIRKSSGGSVTIDR